MPSSGDRLDDSEVGGRAMTAGTELLAASKGFLEAPAGCGKTELIARALTDTTERQLVLTHTHAGVQALRRRATRLGASPRRFDMETLTAFAMRYACAYPGISGLADSDPAARGRFKEIFPAAARVFRSRIGREVLNASYGGVIVDEYQDCTRGQHDAVLALAETLPCRVLGDPLQAVFQFEDDLIDWSTDVLESFEAIPFESSGYRWTNVGSHRLEAWLRDVRAALLAGQTIDLERAPIDWINGSPDLPKAKRTACYRALDKKGGIVAIECLENPSHFVAQRVGGFVSLEPIEAQGIRVIAEQLDATTGIKRARLLVDFAASCATKVSTEMASYAKHLDQGDADFSKLRKHPKAGEALQRVVQGDDADALQEALREVASVGRVYRRDRYDVMLRGLRFVSRGESPTITDGVRRARHFDSHLGRREYRCVASYPLLVKGLEFDHGVVLAPDAMTREHLYVALTRGSRSLSIVSATQQIKPKSVPLRRRKRT